MSQNRGPGVLGVLAVVLVTALATAVLLRSVLWYQRRLLRVLSSQHVYATQCMVPDLGRSQRLALTADPATVQVWHLRRSPDLLLTWRGQPVSVTSTPVDIVTRTLPGIVVGQGEQAMEVVAATASLSRWTRPGERDALVDLFDRNHGKNRGPAARPRVAARTVARTMLGLGVGRIPTPKCRSARILVGQRCAHAPHGARSWVHANREREWTGRPRGSPARKQRGPARPVRRGWADPRFPLLLLRVPVAQRVVVVVVGEHPLGLGTWRARRVWDPLVPTTSLEPVGTPATGYWSGSGGDLGCDAGTGPGDGHLQPHLGRPPSLSRSGRAPHRGAAVSRAGCLTWTWSGRIGELTCFTAWICWRLSLQR